METPDKIYINPNIENRTWLIGKGDTHLTEYTRTDAFIEKACEWLSKHAKHYYFNKEGHYLGTDELVEDFKLSMELQK